GGQQRRQGQHQAERQRHQGEERQDAGQQAQQGNSLGLLPGKGRAGFLIGKLRARQRARVLGQPPQIIGKRPVGGIGCGGVRRGGTFGAGLQGTDRSLPAQSLPLVNSRASMKPATAAIPTARPGLLRTNSLASSASSSSSL